MAGLDLPIGTPTGEVETLSSWAAPYVTNMLGKGQALSNMPYQAYGGPLTAGQSPLQTQAFQGLANLAIPTNQQMTYNPQSFTGGSFAQPMAQQPMAPSGLYSNAGSQQSGFGGVGSINMVTGQPWNSSNTPRNFDAEFEAFSRGDTSPPSSINTTYASDLNPSSADQILERVSKMGLSNLMNDPSKPRRIKPMFAGARGPDDRPIAQQPMATVAVDDFGRQQRELAGPGPTTADLLKALGQTPPTAQQPMQQQPMQQSPIEQYMSPYLQGALDPQYAAAQRQADISAQNLQSQYGKAGAYGGSRQGIAEAELQRGLLDRMAGITGTGYQQAFEQAQRQFNTEQDRQMQAARQAQTYGLEALGAQRTGGAEQRGIESEGVAADYAQFREERDYPFKQVDFQKGLLSSLPIQQTTTQYADPSTLQKFGAGASEILTILDLLGFTKKEG